MNFLKDQIKDQKILEMEVSFDEFIKENNISDAAIIHTMVFDKDVFKDEKEVREYLKDKWFYNPEITESTNEFTAVVVSQNQIDSDTEIKVGIRRGVVAHAADLLPVLAFEEIRFNEKGEVNLSCKFGTVNLSDGLPHIIEIARVAKGEHPLYGTIDIKQEYLESFESNYKSNVTEVDLAVNEDHKKNEAFGWFKDVFLSFDKQTLYGQIQWNTKGTTALGEKEYRYFSPELRFNYVHPHTGTEHGPTLLGGALTNYPFLKMDAIVDLSNKNSQGEKNVSTPTIDLSVHNEKVIELSNKVTTTQVKLDAADAKNIELSSKVTALESEIEKSKKAITHEKLFTEGKINKAQLVALNEGKTFLEVLSLNEKMNLDGKGSGSQPANVVELSAKEKEVAKSLDLSDEDFAKYNQK